MRREMTNPAATTDQENFGEHDTKESMLPDITPLEEKLQKALDKALYANGSTGAQKIRNFLNGTWLGEPLHVVLTDVPIGAWTVALLFDGLEWASHKHELAVAADAAIGLGVAGAAGAAVTGVTGWPD